MDADSKRAQDAMDKIDSDINSSVPVNPPMPQTASCLYSHCIHAGSDLIAMSAISLYGAGTINGLKIAISGSDLWGHKSSRGERLLAAVLAIIPGAKMISEMKGKEYLIINISDQAATTYDNVQTLKEINDAMSKK